MQCRHSRKAKVIKTCHSRSYSGPLRTGTAYWDDPLFDCLIGADLLAGVKALQPFTDPVFDEGIPLELGIHSSIAILGDGVQDVRAGAPSWKTRGPFYCPSANTEAITPDRRRGSTGLTR